MLVGGGEMESELKAQIVRLHLEKFVIMVGPLPPHSIPEMYALIDILVYPRYSMRLTEMVTPLKPLEAMAMRKVVVASDVGGHRELIQDGSTGLLFPAGSLTGLVHAFERVLDNHGLRRTLGARGVAWVREKRTWDKTTAAYSEVYDKALNCSLLGRRRNVIV
jgi:glycosyltransferase involved in cell wall biosynthesis